MARVNLTKPTLSMNYESVVSCDIVYISFLIAVLNDLDTLAGETHIVYLNYPKKEKGTFLC